MGLLQKYNVQADEARLITLTINDLETLIHDVIKADTGLDLEPRQGFSVTKHENSQHMIIALDKRNLSKEQLDGFEAYYHADLDSPYFLQMMLYNTLYMHFDMLLENQFYILQHPLKKDSVLIILGEKDFSKLNHL